MPAKVKTLKELQTIWYKKLAKSGFEDIEHGGYSLKVWHSRFFSSNSNTVSRTAKEEYYRLAGQFLYEYEFVNAFEKFVWTFHSEGLPIVRIVVRLKKEGFKTYRDAVHRTIKRLKEVMVTRARA